MKHSTLVLFLVLIAAAAALISAMSPQPVYAGAQQCRDASGLPVECPGRGEKEKRPTPTETRTPKATPTYTPTSTEIAAILPITGIGGGNGGSANDLPGAENTADGSVRPILPGLLGMIIAVLLMGLGGLFLFRRFLNGLGKNPGPVGSAPEPHLDDDPTNQFMKYKMGDGSVKLGDGSISEGPVPHLDASDQLQKWHDPGSIHEGAEPHLDASDQMQKVRTDPGSINEGPAPHLDASSQL